MNLSFLALATLVVCLSGESNAQSIRCNLTKFWRFSWFWNFDRWLAREKAELAEDDSWIKTIPKCPKRLRECSTSESGFCCDNPKYETDPEAGWAEECFHCNNLCMRSFPSSKGAGQQCCYDPTTGELVTTIDECAGSPDKYSPSFSTTKHFFSDVVTFNQAKRLGRVADYLAVRRPNEGSATETC